MPTPSSPDEVPDTPEPDGSAGTADTPDAAPSRFSAAELMAPTLLFVGAFLLAATVALPTLLVPMLKEIKLDTDFTTVAMSTEPVEVFDQCSVDAPRSRTVLTEVTRQQRVVVVQPSDDSRATLQAGTSLRANDDTDAGLGDCVDATITAVRDRVTLDRRTAQPDLAGGGASEIQYDDQQAPVAVPERRGYTYLLPFSVDVDADHEFFDVTTRTSVPLVYQGETQVNGRSADRFVAEVPDTDLQAAFGDTSAGRPTSITKPASWFGLVNDRRPAVTANLHHASRWELSVDRATGTILDQRVTIAEAYRPIDLNAPDFALPNLAATFVYDDQTREDMGAIADDLGSPITLWGRLVPIVTGLLGVIALGLGLWTMNPDRAERLRGRLGRGRGRGDREPRDRAPTA